METTIRHCHLKSKESYFSSERKMVRQDHSVAIISKRRGLCVLQPAIYFKVLTMTECGMPPTCLQTFQTFSHTWLDLEQYIFRQKSHLPMPELLHLQISVSSIVCLVRAAWHLSSASVPWFSTIFWAAAADCTELKILEDLTICYFLERNRTGEKEAFTHKLYMPSQSAC